MILLGEPGPNANNAGSSEANREPRMLLKTIRAFTRPRGFESHALRSTSEERFPAQPVEIRMASDQTAHGRQRGQLGPTARPLSYLPRELPDVVVVRVHA